MLRSLADAHFASLAIIIRRNPVEIAPANMDTERIAPTSFPALVKAVRLYTIWIYLVDKT